jgi:hypothetical protein
VLLTVGIILLTLIGVAGSHAWSGPDVLKITSDHGVHLLDLFVLAAGAAGLVACWWAQILERSRETVDEHR